MKQVKYLIHVFAFSLCLAFAGCNQQERNEAAQESQQAYNEFKTYVSEAETRADQEFNEAERDWDKEMNEWRSAYQEKEANLERNMENYDEATQKEIGELKTRYQTAWKRTEENYTNYRHYLEMRENLLGVDVKTDDLTEVTAENIRMKYENFVEKVKANADSYDRTEWDHVEGFWSALNTRLSQVEANLDKSAKAAINKTQATYKQVHDQYLNATAE
ncbi:MAG: hypothetical protein LPK19_17040 [Hymenobacteraceae bacterium]|nr:hypothetical protein [Hymenobacteraceae bacterium]MDX5397959.1 hypothetical protein [Hymenobacteraceae bacterium]MDX5514031.1 hypothetical protein [Hymenobacteraceae bacterium]